MPEKIDSVAVEVHINLNGPLWSSEFNLLFARNKPRLLLLLIQKNLVLGLLGEQVYTRLGVDSIYVVF